MTVTDEIKNRLDIVDVISNYVPLRKSGSSYTAFCPFHTNTRTPAFVVFPATQTWRCFGACAEGGDVFNFVMKKEGWDFKEALVQLASQAGVELDDFRTTDPEKRAVEDRLTDLLSAAADYYHQILLYAPQAEKARHYLQDRGLSEETLAIFNIGYALNSWDACKTHFSMQGYSDDELADAGLITVNEEKGSRYDRFRNRVVIPIRQANGTTVGFGARTLDPDGIPKYLNSPQNAVFDKSKLLFGLDMAKRHIREARQVIIVEGYMDVIQAWQNDFRNVVAQMGTALTEQQLRLLKRYTKRFVIALDADAAGNRATMRSLEVAREVLDREADVRFDARGLVRHEGRLQADIRVVSLPKGMDPDLLIRTDPETWPKLVAQSKPVVAYVIDLATEGLDMSDAKAKTEVARQILPLIDDILDPVEREHYRQMLARKLGVDERALRNVSVPKSRRSSTLRSKAVEEKGGSDKTDAKSKGLQVVMEGGLTAGNLRRSDYLRQCMSYPHILVEVDRRLKSNKQAPVSPKDFIRNDDRLLLEAIQKYLGQSTVAITEDLCDSLLTDDFLRDRVQTLLDLPKTEKSEIDRLPDRLVMSVLDWRLEGVRALLSEVKELFYETKVENNTEMLALYNQQLRELPLQVLNINRARNAMSATSKRSQEADIGLWNRRISSEAG